MSKIEKIKLLAAALFAAFGVTFLFTDNGANRSAHAFSAGPPAGYTRAPGEEPEACAECHVVDDPGTGQLTIGAPQQYVPGQTYQITVSHSNQDQTRLRWGFQLTALDPGDERAGTLESLDGFTQVVAGQGPFPARQYAEHTSAGTFPGQTGGANWTFRWTAPPTDIGPVTFYAAGNQANGDGNTSGDNIYFTFVSANPAPPTPDFGVAVSPGSRLVTPGASATYNVTVTPSGGFTGGVTLGVAGLPANTSAAFNPPTVNLNSASPQSSTLTVTTGANTPVGTSHLTVNAASGALQRTASAGLVVQNLTLPALFVADLTGAQEVPPNNSPARGTATLLLGADGATARVSVNFAGLVAPQTDAHVHGPAPAGVSAAVLQHLPTGSFADHQITLTPEQVRDLNSGLLYVNIHSSTFPAGEIRGQLTLFPSSRSITQLGPASAAVSEGAHVAVVSVTRMGDTSQAAGVTYTTANGTASERTDYTAARGTLQFAPGETAKTFNVLLTDDAFVEGGETVNLALSNPTGATALGPQATATLNISDNDSTPPTANPIDDAAFFVRRHYHDFLNREPDAAGLAFWTNQITECGQNAQCREARRVNVSAAFFLSIEFQQTGYFVYRFYEASFDRQPRLSEFLPDTQEIGRGVVVGVGDWQAQLEANRRAFADAWAARPAFRNVYDALSNSQYVDRLFSNAGVTPQAAERAALISGLDAGTETRATVLRRVAENADFNRLEFNRAFVLEQYFGYLRRNPDDPPDADFGGYNFWLSKLNQFGGNFVNAEMVKAFIVSGEYRQRFGP